MKSREELRELYARGQELVNGKRLREAASIFASIIYETDDDAILGLVYGQLSFINLNKDDFDAAIESGEKAAEKLFPIIIREGEKRRDLAEMLGKVYRQVGVSYLRKHEKDYARGWLEKASDISERLNLHEELARTLSYLAELSRDEGDFEEAEKLLKRAIKIALESGLTRQLKYLYRNIGEVYSMQNKDMKSPEKSREAIKYYLKEIPLHEKRKDWRELAYAYSNIALEYTRIPNYDLEHMTYFSTLATSYFKKALEEGKAKNIGKDILLMDLAGHFDFLAYKIFQAKERVSPKYIKAYIERAEKYIQSCAESDTPIEPELLMQLELLAILANDQEEAKLRIRYKAIEAYKEWFDRIKFDKKLSQRQKREIRQFEHLCYFMVKDKRLVAEYIGEDAKNLVTDMHSELTEFMLEQGIERRD